MQISRPGWYICFNASLWGIVSACTGAVTSYAGLAVCRTMLGVVEAAFFPGGGYLIRCAADISNLPCVTVLPASPDGLVSLLSHHH